MPPRRNGFDIHTAAAAWAELGKLNAGEFEAVRSELRRLAELSANYSDPGIGSARPVQRTVRVGELTLRYSIDRAMRRISLEAVSRGN